jgi:hypothetical protein
MSPHYFKTLAGLAYTTGITSRHSAGNLCLDSARLPLLLDLCYSELTHSLLRQIHFPLQHTAQKNSPPQT